MKFEKLIGKKVTLYNKKNFRFSGIVQDVDENFIEIFDDIKKKEKMINIEEISEVEVNE